jgi:hypothetical protein
VLVFSFTVVLFFAGYSIQQQTLRGLQEAIKPEPRTKHDFVYLPDKFRTKSDTDLVVEISNEDEIQLPLPDHTLQDLPEVVKGQSKQLTNDPVAEEDASVEDYYDVQRNADPLEGLNKAERRRRIKQDIQEMAETDRKGYKRRLY